MHLGSHPTAAPLPPPCALPPPSPLGLCAQCNRKTLKEAIDKKQLSMRIGLFPEPWVPGARAWASCNLDSTEFLPREGSDIQVCKGRVFSLSTEYPRDGSLFSCLVALWVVLCDGGHGTAVSGGAHGGVMERRVLALRKFRSGAEGSLV